MNDDDLTADDLVEQAIAYDRSLTDEERRKKREEMRINNLTRCAEDLVDGISKGMPGFLLARMARLVYKRAASCWPRQMAQIVATETIEDSRRRCGQCVVCGKDLPMPYDPASVCATCHLSGNDGSDDMEGD